jgi:hypothetical protein
VEVNNTRGRWDEVARLTVQAADKFKTGLVRHAKILTLEDCAVDLELAWTLVSKLHYRVRIVCTGRVGVG